MAHYCKLGDVPHKRHTQFRGADGALYHEELMGIHGFSGIKSLLYHRRPPTRVEKVPAQATFPPKPVSSIRRSTWLPSDYLRLSTHRPQRWWKMSPLQLLLHQEMAAASIPMAPTT